MERLVHRGVLAARVGHQPVLLEAPLRVIAATREDHIDAPAQVAEDRAAVAVQAGDHFHLAAVMQHPAIGLWPEHRRQIVHTARRKVEPVGRHQSRRIGNRGHLEGALGAVEERVEHLRVHAADAGLFGRQAVVAPHGVRRRRVIHRQVLGALARGDHLEPARARPVDHLADQRRLVAVRQRVDDSCFLRPAGQQRPGQRIGFDVHHHDVLAMLAARQHMPDPGRWRPGGVDHDVDIRLRDHPRALVEEAHRTDGCVRPADALQRLLRTGRAEVGDRGDSHARRVPYLREVHRTELAGTDQADAERPPSRFALLQQAMQVHVRSPWLVNE